MLSEALAWVAVPSRIKVNYHILFLTGHHLLAGQRARTRTHAYSHTSSQVHIRSDHQRKTVCFIRGGEVACAGLSRSSSFDWSSFFSNYSASQSHIFHPWNKKESKKKKKSIKKLKQRQALPSELCPDTACLASFIASQHIKSNMKWQMSGQRCLAGVKQWTAENDCEQREMPNHLQRKWQPGQD